MNDVLNVNNPRSRISGKQYTRSAAAQSCSRLRETVLISRLLFMILSLCIVVPPLRKKNRFLSRQTRPTPSHKSRAPLSLRACLSSLEKREKLTLVLGASSPTELWSGIILTACYQVASFYLETYVKAKPKRQTTEGQPDLWYTWIRVKSAIPNFETDNSGKKSNRKTK